MYCTGECSVPFTALQRLDYGLFAAWSNASTRVLASPRNTGMTWKEAGYRPELSFPSPRNALT